MAFTKRTTGDLNLTSINGNIVATAAYLTVVGNLLVTGNTTTIEVTQLQVVDNLITLNSNVTSGSPSAGNSGIEVRRGSSANAMLIWNESVTKWQVYDGTTLSNIQISSGNGFITKVQEDTSPNLGGNLNTNAFSILSSGVSNINISSNGNLTISPNLTSNTYATVVSGFMRLPNPTLNNPAAVSNNTIVYANTASSVAGSGIYFINSSTTDELVSKQKAILYGLIL